MSINIKEIDETFHYYKKLRRDLHANPELGLHETRTSLIITHELEKLGYQVTSHIAGTGLVATFKLGNGEKSIGLRADMDALPIVEKSNLPHSSQNAGVMHACGHDGHVATLLCAANALVVRKRFNGTLHLIFQPAEENAGGANLMIKDGLFERFPCDFVFGMHNDPLLPLGKVSWRYGAIMAAVDSARITLKGPGGHEGLPHLAADTIVASASIIMALQTILSRNIDPCNPAVLNVGSIHSGTTSGIIPDETTMEIGLRSFDSLTRNLIEEKLNSIVSEHAKGFDVKSDVKVTRWYGPTINDKEATNILLRSLNRAVDQSNLVELEKPFMFSEDFSFMLNKCPGSYFFVGGAKGHDDYSLHHPSYDFNDDVIKVGSTIWTTLVEDYLCA